MSTSFEQGHLRGESAVSESVVDLLQGDYDLAFLFPSWDARCLCITAGNRLKATVAVVVDFANRGVHGLRDVHDPRILNYAESISERLLRVSGVSEDLEGLWAKILDQFLLTYRFFGRPLRILVDLSTSPRFFTLGLLACGVRAGLLRQATFFYAEADYEDRRSFDSGEELFTTGRWETLPIPALLGNYSPEKDRHYVISVGWEGPKTLRVVSRADPDKVSIVFPEPGYHPRYVEKTMAENRLLIQQFGVPGSRIVKAPAGDAIEAWKRMEEFVIDDAERDNAYYLCCGTKPHSLALTLRAMALSYPTVLYNKPDRHKELRVSPSGKYWSFQVVDLSAIV